GHDGQIVGATWVRGGSTPPTPGGSTSSPPPGDYALQLHGWDKDGDQAASVDVPSLLLDQTESLTLETRVMGLGHNEGHVVGIDGFRLSLRSGAWVTRLAGSAYLKAPAPFDQKRWYHLAAVRTASEVRMYVDGKLVERRPLQARTGPQPPSNKTALKIGG